MGCQHRGGGLTCRTTMPDFFWNTLWPLGSPGQAVPMWLGGGGGLQSPVGTNFHTAGPAHLPAAGVPQSYPTSVLTAFGGRACGRAASSCASERTTASNAGTDHLEAGRDGPLTGPDLRSPKIQSSTCHCSGLGKEGSISYKTWKTQSFYQAPSP